METRLESGLIGEGLWKKNNIVERREIVREPATTFSHQNEKKIHFFAF